ncbi:MAG TPA: tRNA 2-selenouridine(34) synthase MnmH [Bacteroidales bacterium]|nr:tRNA 2-selenouridine(34) synthase MnmH [Bacteroidales bacterium]HNS46949.1 tRNA 2-selenouridine(34) synthase MnmH [Bacteroidales bacterium]
MIKTIDITELFGLLDSLPLIDVRSPQEFRSGHIPGAFNLPLFNDEERALVGTRFVRTGRFSSVQLGLDLVGHKLSGTLNEARKIAADGPFLIHCWRGGLRSASMAWLFDLAGMNVLVLSGGYKAYRNHIRQELGKPARLVVLAGKTGSGKTSILHALAQSGQQVLDLEKIAHHKGSVFGGLGMMPQPTNEQFENGLYSAWSQLDLGRPIWIEDESLSVGSVSIPEPLFSQLLASPVLEIEVSFSRRVERLVREYSNFPGDDLISCILRIEKKLGGDNTRKAIDAVKEGDFTRTAEILLTYYDRAYDRSLQMRAAQISRISLPLPQDDPLENAKFLLGHYQPEKR